MQDPGKEASSGHRVAWLVSLLMLGALLAAPSAALAAVSVAKASLSSASLRVEGKGALANATVSVSSPESTATAKADSKGQFKVSASAYSSSTCKATVSDGSTSVVATLSSCTPASSPPPPTSPPPPPPPTDPPPPATAPVLTPDLPELGPGNVGAEFTAGMTFARAVGPVDFQIIAGALPAGLSLFDPYGGDTPAKAIHRAIVGTPTTVQTSTFTVRATDSNGATATRTYTIRINPALTLAINPQAWAPLTVGSFANLWIDGIGGVRPYKWARTAGAFPTGMSLIQDNPSGPLVRVSGTPTTAGTYTFTLRLTDAQGSTVSRTFTVPVS